MRKKYFEIIISGVTDKPERVEAREEAVIENARQNCELTRSQVVKSWNHGSIVSMKNLVDHPIWKVSYKGSKPIELNKVSLLEARKHYARYHNIQLDDVIGYDYLRIKPVGMI